MRNFLRPLLIALIAIGAALLLPNLLAPKMAVGAPTNATRIPFGIFFTPRSSNSTDPLPSPSPGIYANQYAVMQACAAANPDAGTQTCYPIASPMPSPGGSADAGTALGAGATAKIDTCSTGGLGTTCYTLESAIFALKKIGALKL